MPGLKSGLPHCARGRHRRYAPKAAGPHLSPLCQQKCRRLSFSYLMELLPPEVGAPVRGS